MMNIKFPILLNNWENQDISNVFEDFVAEVDCSNVNVLLASYGTPSYEGHAFVLFQSDGKLYEVNGSHCSCYGLENQWLPEETTSKELRHRIINGCLGDGKLDENPFSQELLQILDYLDDQIV